MTWNLLAYSGAAASLAAGFWFLEMLAELVVAEVGLRFVQARLQALKFAPEHQSRSVNLC